MEEIQKPAPSQPAAGKSNLSFFVPFIFMTVLTVAFFSLSGYFGYRYYQQKKILSTSEPVEVNRTSQIDSADCPKCVPAIHGAWGVSYSFTDEGTCYSSNRTGVDLCFPDKFKVTMNGGYIHSDDYVNEDISIKSDNEWYSIMFVSKNGGIERGSIINGVDLEEVGETFIKSKGEEKFKVITYLVNGKFYMLEAILNDPESEYSERVYIKTVTAVATEEKLLATMETFKDIISTVEID